MTLTPSLSPLRPSPDELVRVGREYDGGYVISARAMREADVLIGLGVNTDWSFEEDFQERNPSTRLIMVDGSVSGGVFFRQGVSHAIEAAWLLATGRWSAMKQEWTLGKWYRDLSRQFTGFLRAPSRRFIRRMIDDSEFAGELTLAELMKFADDLSGSPSSRIFVKMDVEGKEYRVLSQLMAYQHRITGLAIEFHDCDLLWPRLTEVLDQMAEHFVLVHTHGNNCAPLIDGTDVPRVLELSFLHRSLASTSSFNSALPRYPLPGLDMANDPKRDDYTLAFPGTG